MTTPVTITPSQRFAPVNVQSIAKLWEDTKSGTKVRQGNTGLAVSALVATCNHLLTNMPRVTFGRAWPFAERQTTGEAPLCIWRFLDSVVNARDWVYRLLTVPRTSGSNDAYAERYTDATVKTPVQGTMSSATFPDDIVEATMEYTRGAQADAVIEEGISTYNNYSVTDIVVQDKNLTMLDVAQHDYAAPGGTGPGRPVIANVMSQLRTAFHSVRKNCLPVWSIWNAYRSGAAWDTPAATGSTGVRVEVGGLKNIIDGTSTSRTAATPGSSHHVYRMGRGEESKDDGKKVAVQVAVYAYAPTNGGSVRVIGPDHIASNQVDITLTAGGGNGWYTAASKVYLNSAAATTDTTTERNKLDYLASSTLDPPGTQEEAYIYTIAAWMTYEI